MFNIKVIANHCGSLIGLDKGGYPVNIFFISPRKHMLWYSLEVPRRDASNEYHNICFCGEIRKISILWIEKSALTSAMAQSDARTTGDQVKSLIPADQQFFHGDRS